MQSGRTTAWKGPSSPPRCPFCPLRLRDSLARYCSPWNGTVEERARETGHNTLCCPLERTQGLPAPSSWACQLLDPNPKSSPASDPGLGIHVRQVRGSAGPPCHV